MSHSGLDSMLHISQTIKQKERELQEIHETRCVQLENMVMERDHLLIEAAKRFDKIKEDFQYNLTLLEARDLEIERLDGIVEKLNDQVSRLQTELQGMHVKYDLLDRKATLEVDKHNEEKQKSKKVLQELRDAVESMEWTAAEESKSKSKELESLRNEIKRLGHVKEEALQTQRHDITLAFEQLIQQREDAFTSKENQINEQIVLLGNRLEQISTDNISLKSQYQSSLRTIEELTVDNTSKEDTIRKLQWKLEDERAAKIESDEILHRNLQQTAYELSTLRTSLQTESQENKRLVEGIEHELIEEKNQREASERQVDAIKKRWQHEKSELESVIHEMTSELKSKREEIADLKEKIQEISHNSKTLHQKLDFAEQDLLNHKDMNNDLQNQISQLQDVLHESNEKLASVKLSNLQSIRSLELENDRFKKSIESQYSNQLRELQSEFDMKQMEYDIKITSLESDLTTTTRLLEEKSKALEDEKSEGAALRLRLQLLENQMLSLRQKRDKDSIHNNELSGHPTGSSSSSAFGLLNDELRYSKDSHSNHGQGMYHHGINSPAFSEDMGPASISRLSQNTDTHHRMLQYQEYDDENEKLLNENESLKRVIKEMRQDIENLTTASPVKSGSDDPKAEILEKRLEQMTNEVNRLRNERRKLIDNSNELRAAMNMQTAMSYESNRMSTFQSNEPPDNEKKSQTKISREEIQDLSSRINDLHVEGVAASKQNDQRPAERVNVQPKTQSLRKPPVFNPSTTATASLSSKNHAPSGISSRRVANFNVLKELQDHS